MEVYADDPNAESLAVALKEIADLRSVIKEGNDERRAIANALYDLVATGEAALARYRVSMISEDPRRDDNDDVAIITLRARIAELTEERDHARQRALAAEEKCLVYEARQKNP